MADMVFISISFLLILSCLGVCMSKNLVHSAVCLFFALFLIAGYYIMLYADFLAAVQVIVYVGGILVLIIFGVMLTNRLEKPSIDISSFNQFTAGLLCFFLFCNVDTAVSMSAVGIFLGEVLTSILLCLPGSPLSSNGNVINRSKVLDKNSI